jgi:hypothetical protein
MLKGEVPGAFQKAVVENFTPRLTHELQRMLSAINPKSAISE